jgi:hypothetical protein
MSRNVISDWWLGLLALYDVLMPDWTFLTNHAHVLICVSRDPGIRLRDIGASVGITEGAAQRIVADLVDAGYLTREREGRRNRYELRRDLPLRHPLEHDHRIGEILAVLQPQGQASHIA